MRTLPSLTAEAVCLARALDRRHAPSHRLLDDPFADTFLRRPERAGRRAITLTPGNRAIEALLDPGLVAAIAARHVWIDERMVACLADVDQVVIVGAGYDSRAWRFAAQLAGRTVIEVDHPATAERKARCVRRHPGLPDTTWLQVPTDLRHRRLDEALRAAGVDGRRTCFVWEGVSMYLTRFQVLQAMQHMRDSSAAGSHLIMDLWTPSTGFGVRALGERFGRVGLAAIGEPLRFMLHAHEVPGLLAPMTLRVLHQDTVKSLAMRRAGRRAFPDLHMAHIRL